MLVKMDENLPFPFYTVKCKTKKEQRQYVASHANMWLSLQKKRGAKGAVMIDIDDTLIDSNGNVRGGFEHMKELYLSKSLDFPFHIVTARPDDDHEYVMGMLSRRGFHVPPDRLHMLPAQHYGKAYSYVEDFKWKTFLKIAQQHSGCVARFGDKMWDVAHFEALKSYLSHVDDKQSCIFLDPSQKGCVSYKLPGY